jgi:hypothetical protein
MRWRLAIGAALVGCTDTTAAPATPDSSLTAVDAATLAVVDATRPDSSASALDAHWPAWLELSPRLPGGAEPIPTVRHSRRLTPDQMAPLVKSRLMQTCFQDFDAGASALTIVINVDGRATRATWDRNDPIVEACVEAELRSWRFPVAGMWPQHLDITFP